VPTLIVLQAAELLNNFGPALGGAFIAIVFLAGGIGILYRRLDAIYALRIQELIKGYGDQIQILKDSHSVAIAQQKEQYEARLAASDQRVRDFQTLAGFQQAIIQRGTAITDAAINALPSGQSRT
jgi:hypothetical protein